MLDEVVVVWVAVGEEEEVVAMVEGCGGRKVKVTSHNETLFELVRVSFSRDKFHVIYCSQNHETEDLHNSSQAFTFKTPTNNIIITSCAHRIIAFASSAVDS